MFSFAPARSASHPDSRVRVIKPWRDGRSVADLLELAFKDEPFDEGGRRMLRMLRHYDPFEAAAWEGSKGFVWEENGEIMGNASIQQNPLRKNTWVVGNVAVHPAQRSQGIGRALMQAAIQHARQKRGRFVALQVVDGNTHAMRLYDNLGFRRVGLASHYRRAALNALPIASDDAAEAANLAKYVIRPAQRREAAAIWGLTRQNVPDDLTYSEPFDPALYRPGWIWWMDNLMNGNMEHWFVAAQDGVLAGAIRARASYDTGEHVLELMLNESAGVEVGVGLTRAALLKLETFAAQPITAVQSHPHTPSHAALRAMGFKPVRALAHMVMSL